MTSDQQASIMRRLWLLLTWLSVIVVALIITHDEFMDWQPIVEVRSSAGPFAAIPTPIGTDCGQNVKATKGFCPGPYQPKFQAGETMTLTRDLCVFRAVPGEFIRSITNDDDDREVTLTNTSWVSVNPPCGPLVIAIRIPPETRPGNHHLRVKLRIKANAYHWIERILPDIDFEVVK